MNKNVLNFITVQIVSALDWIALNARNALQYILGKISKIFSIFTYEIIWFANNDVLAPSFMSMFDAETLIAHVYLYVVK